MNLESARDRLIPRDTTKVLIARADYRREIDTCAKLIQVSDTSRERISAIAISTYYYEIYERAKRGQIEMRERFRALYKQLTPSALESSLSL